MRLGTIILILLSLASAAIAQSLGGMSGLGPLVSKSSGGGGGAVVVCAGVIDASIGCPLPML